ncbi:hypothetical protein BV210_09500 [Halorientalis sp. IM1011]|uniref:hypothetical protein n=1 Tax=Halorientalis sp. IM1011 TaxID=1932360 RepID=UPI00097CD4AA|nr:hypothetical protein [Halorientalis sp. IM1011]AQL42936.1 hypothetical protein BV210_09500 [Halorientalis sp. IM1011]
MEDTERHWQRRRDLEGGKELGIWLLIDGGAVERELYVESHEYRGGAFDVFTYADGDWIHEGEFETATDAFAAAGQALAESDAPVADT